jgi:dTDP-4-amino-4,6-dideoxygalactose transaminase
MVPFFDYRPAYHAIRDEIDAAIRAVLESGTLILGPQVEALEEEFSAYVGLRRAVGVNSGTDALALALRALDIGKGDEVITVANAGVPPVAAIRMVGAMPRFVDVLPGSCLMDPGLLDAALTPRTRCVLPVHLYGQPAPLRAILEFASRHGLAVVEDCAQAHGARYDGKHVGGFGSIGCFSFYPTKNMGAYGDGGICVTDDPDLFRRLRMLRQYGFFEDRHAHCEGWNSRLDEIQAAILRVQLRHLDDTIHRRRELASLYSERLRGGPLRIPGEEPGGTHTYHLYVVRHRNRNQLTERLRTAGVGHGIHYPEPVYRMEAYGFFGVGPGRLPQTDLACNEVLSLPLYNGMESDTVALVARALRDPA